MTDPHAEYLATCPPHVRERLEVIRAEAESRVSGTLRAIAYKMPALRLGQKQGRIFFYFAAFKRHIGIYPPLHGPAELLEELAPYTGPKGNLSFPHDAPLPLDLIGRVCTGLAAQYTRES